MKKNLIFKALAIVLFFFLFTMQSFAKNAESNTISKIIVEPLTNDNYTLSLLFNNEYKGNAFLQKRESGSYLVFIPDTSLNAKKTKIIYKDKKDKSKINLHTEERPIQKGGKKSNYVKISVDMADDYSIRLVSGLNSDYNGAALFVKNLDFVSIIVIVLAIFAILILNNALKQVRISANTQKCKTRYPSAFLNSPAEYLNNIKKESEDTIQKNMLPKMNMKNSIKPADKSSFDCFELPFAEDLKTNSNYEFKSTLQQASKLLKEKPSLVKLRHTNPIAQNSRKESSELSMPAVEDVLQKKPKETEKKTQKQSGAELLSVLNITPNKGFYLTTVDETLALFGFINENVFLFKKFKDLSQINLQARFYDKNGRNDIYIVRLDTYKAMIEISDNSMKELAKI